MPRIARATVAASAVVALVLALAPSVLAADHAVDIAGFAFSPTSITVSVGDTVTWSNADAQSHTATADDGSFDTGTITSSTPKSVTFSAAGTFAYHCKIHPAMTATVIVAAATATAPTTDAPLGESVLGGGSSAGLLIVVVGVGSAVFVGAWLARRRT
jgi:plastocyanin